MTLFFEVIFPLSPTLEHHLSQDAELFIHPHHQHHFRVDDLKILAQESDLHRRGLYICALYPSLSG